MFEVQLINPPPRSLGIFALPPNTHNGEEVRALLALPAAAALAAAGGSVADACAAVVQIEIDGQGYVVTSLVLRYKV